MKRAYIIYVYFLLLVYKNILYVLTDWYFEIPLPFSLNLPNFPFFSYNVSHDNFYDYFLSEYVTFDFWNVQF